MAKDPEITIDQVKNALIRRDIRRILSDALIDASVDGFVDKEGQRAISLICPASKRDEVVASLADPTLLDKLTKVLSVDEVTMIPDEDDSEYVDLVFS